MKLKGSLSSLGVLLVSPFGRKKPFKHLVTRQHPASQFDSKAICQQTTIFYTTDNDCYASAEGTLHCAARAESSAQGRCTCFKAQRWLFSFTHVQLDSFLQMDNGPRTGDCAYPMELVIPRHTNLSVSQFRRVPVVYLKLRSSWLMALLLLKKRLFGVSKGQS